MINYDENPSENSLKQIQTRLDAENKTTNHTVGIVDIGMGFGGRYCVVMEDEKPVAVAAIADHGEVYKLYVCPENRGYGIAEKLVLRLIEQEASSEGDGLFVEMTPESLSFWEKMVQKHNLKFEKYDGQLKIELWLN
ncbi:MULTISPECIES: GNAT family N-acetyltransferase [unclassified Serratia (in: enterobacteria)]|uniref:GNAT family N-acetyltransferase n=1 Tax=unclassified Serratia (in: enterobacteria) TaxID=2647522 RepID=UPI001EEDD7CA|nr:GNAT family N-acetyltransferase [Serratia marcescens]